jgi:hypothetical protein
MKDWSVVGINKGEYCSLGSCINVAPRMRSDLFSWLQSYGGF